MKTIPDGTATVQLPIYCPMSPTVPEMDLTYRRMVNCRTAGCLKVTGAAGVCLAEAVGEYRDGEPCPFMAGDTA